MAGLYIDNIPYTCLLFPFIKTLIINIKNFYFFQLFLFLYNWILKGEQ
jgi:hypothetical protein